MTLLAGQAAWVAVGLGTGLLFALAVVATIGVFFAVFDDDARDIEDVKRFIELREEARRLLAPGLPLIDGEQMAAASAEVARFQAKRDEARRALWSSRDGRPDVAAREESASRPPGRERVARLAEPARRSA